MNRGKVRVLTNSEEIRDKCKEGRGVWHATVTSIDEILVKTGRNTEGSAGTCVPDEIISSINVELNMWEGEYWDDLSGAR